jgi:large repetitive protein
VSFSEVRTDGNCADNYTLTRTWTATDRCGNSSSAMQVITVQDTQAPMLSGVPANTTVQCDNIPAPAQPTATDNCDPAPVITYQQVRTNGNCPYNYTLTRTWTATDRCGNSSSQTQVITVQDTQAPVITCPVNRVVPCGPTTEDPAAGQVLTPALMGIPTAVDNCDAAPIFTYVDQTTPGICQQAFTILRTWTASDICGNTSTCQQTISVVDNQAPTGSCPQGLSNLASLNDVPAPDPAAVAANYTDNCSDNVTATLSNTTTTGNACQGYTVTYSYTISDGCGNMAACSVVHRVRPANSLVGTCPDAVTGLQCWADVPTGQAALPIVQQSYSSTSGLPVMVIYLGSTVINNFCSFTYQHIYQVTDPCTGTRTICTLTYSGNDLTPPTGTCPSGLSGLSCKSQVPPPNPAAIAANYTDNCSSTTFAYLVNTIETGPECGNFSVTYVYHVYDDCFNYAVCEVTHTGTSGLRQITQLTGDTQEGIQPKVGMKLSAYPNPAQNEVVIELEEPLEQEAMLVVFDVFGRQVMSLAWPAGERQNRLMLAAEGLPSGTYLLVLRQGDEVATQKILLNKN